MNGRLDTAEEKISELEGIEIKISQNKKKKKIHKRKEKKIASVSHRTTSNGLICK